MQINEEQVTREAWTVAGKLMRGTARGGLYFITPDGVCFEIGEWVVEWCEEPEPMALASPQDVTPDVLRHIIATIKRNQEPTCPPKTSP